MTNAEFESEFDIIYENITSGNAPGLEPYEKSVILTQAAETLAKQLVNIDISRISELIVVDTPVVGTGVDPLDSRSVVFEFPSTFIKILNESVSDGANEYTVVPISPVEYDLVMSKPYRYPRKRTAWRLENSDTSAGFAEIVGRPNVVITDYTIRYVNLPEPIILEDLTTLDITIGGSSGPSNTNLNPALHQDILKLATGLAEQYYYDKGQQENTQK